MCGHSSFILLRRNAYLVTLALVSPRRNTRSRAQTSIFTIENWVARSCQELHRSCQAGFQEENGTCPPFQNFSEKGSPSGWSSSWLAGQDVKGMGRAAAGARNLQEFTARFLNKDSSARSFGVSVWSSQPGVHSQESSAKISQPEFL